MLYSFFITVHARPADVTPGPDIELQGRKLHTLHISPESLSATPMDSCFEVACQRLSVLERMYCEPDGSFVWASPQGDPAWQVDGNLYDRNERLLFVDLKGNCPREQFDRLLTALAWPETKLMFQLTREAVFLDEDEFRRFAVAESNE